MVHSVRLAAFFKTYPHALPQTGRILVLRATNPAQYEFFETKRVYCVQSFKPYCDELDAFGIKTEQSLPETAQAAIVELTRSKPENLANIAKAYEILENGSSLFINGLKTDGIDSISKAVKQRVNILKNYPKAHGKTLWIQKLQTKNPFQDWCEYTDITKNKDGYWTAPGIFSAASVDPASALLVDKLPYTLSGTGADLGAGWGYLSAETLKKHSGISRLDLFEAEQISLNCAQKNITDPRVRFHWEDITKLNVKAFYDFVIMNPPFHIERRADISLGSKFIAQAASLLKPKGQLWMVANKQLAYEQTLNQCFQKWLSPLQNRHYKIIHAVKPRSTTG